MPIRPCQSVRREGLISDASRCALIAARGTSPPFLVNDALSRNLPEIMTMRRG
jgi:hypothetical protein